MDLKVILLFCCGCFFSGCSTTEIATSNVFYDQLFYDQAFPDYLNYPIATPEEIYALDDSMNDFVHSHLMKIEDPFLRSKALLTKLFNQSPHTLRYLNGANLIAAEAFHQNEANCLSLTILAYALADEANLLIKFQEIDIPEYWVREGQFNMLTGHVNLRVIGDKINPYKIIWGNSDITIDFDPYNNRKYFSKRIISKNRVTAMFYNNKGAQAIVNNDLNMAYAYFKHSLNQDPNFSPAWGNLGLVYKKVGLTSYAEQAYLTAIDIDDSNLNAWNNLAILEQEQERFEDAAKIRRFLAKIRNQNPYYHALLGDEAYYKGDYQLAIKYYKQAKAMSPKEHEFYFGLARSFFKLGDYKKSEFYLEKAKRNAHFKDIEDKYQSKLNLLTRL